MIDSWKERKGWREKGKGKLLWCLFDRQERNIRREDSRDFESRVPPFFIFPNVDGSWKENVLFMNFILKYKFTLFIFYNFYSLLIG